LTTKLYLQKKKASKAQPPQVPTSDKPHWFYKSFDLKTNIMGLYKTAKEQKLNENIAIFNFLRTVTSIWVVYFHDVHPYALGSINSDSHWKKFQQDKTLNTLFFGRKFQ